MAKTSTLRPASESESRESSDASCCGRDYAGVVEEGPVEWIGAEVWGTGGDTGFTRDRTHTRQELERQDNLLRGGIAGTRQRLEQATAAHDTASAALAAAEATIESSAAFAMPPP